MAYDDVISQIGEFGRSQRRTYFLLCLPAICCAFHKMGGEFLSGRPNFRCSLPRENPENATFFLPRNIADLNFPWDDKTKSWSQCERYDLDLINRLNVSGGNVSVTNYTVKCDSFLYDERRYKLTTTIEWDLVCDNAWLRVSSDSLFMVGMMLGSLILGGFSDRYGRKGTFFLSLIIQFFASILVAVVPGVISYMVFRTILGAATSGVFLVAYVIALEMVGPKHRLLAGTGYQLSASLGHIVTAGLAYSIRNWRSLQMAFAVPSILFLLYWWFIPESIRWLINKGRLEEAKDLFLKASCEDGVELSEDGLDDLLSNENESEDDPDLRKASVFDLVRYPNLRKKCLVLVLAWLVNGGTYYGLSWNTSNLGGNNYVNFLIAAAVEVPAHMFQFFTLERWGRRITVCGCMLLAATSLLCTLCIPSDMEWLVVVLAVLGKFAITASYDAVYIFTAEQFPTVVRNVGLGACSTSARLGGIAAPYINRLAEVWKPLPLVIFGSCSLIAGVMSLLLPETTNTKLPESIQDGERFGKRLSESELYFESTKDGETTKPLTVLDRFKAENEV